MLKFWKRGGLVCGLVITLACGDGSDGTGGGTTTAITSSTAVNTSDGGGSTTVPSTGAAEVTTVADGTTGTPNEDDYYDMLVARPEHHSSTPLGSAAEVDAAVEFSDPADSLTAYDPTQDAAKFTVQANSGSIQIGDQIRHVFPRVGSGNLFVFWEARASAYWSAEGDVDGVQTYKAFQLSNSGNLTLEPRFRFSQAAPPFFARADVRVYGNQTGVEIGPADSVAPQTGEFEFLPETWTRFWILVDFDSDELSYWAGDTERPVVKILDRVPFDWAANYGPEFGFDQFWFEFNTSQDRTSDEAPCFWGRHLAVLRDVEDPDALVALGSS